MRPATFLFLAGIGLTLAGCGLPIGQFDRAEFAPPQDRWPSNLPSTVARNAAPPPVLQQYCYHTLASVDCFLTPQANRPGFTGGYPALGPPY